MAETQAKLQAGTREDGRYFTMSELAGEFDVTTRTIRFYEAEGMLTPVRRGRSRFFSNKQRTRLKLILRGKRLGFSLAEIREIIDMYDLEPGEAGQLKLFIGQIGRRREDLLQKRRDVDLTLSDLAEVETRCRSRLSELEDH